MLNYQRVKHIKSKVVKTMLKLGKTMSEAVSSGPVDWFCHAPCPMGHLLCGKASLWQPGLAQNGQKLECGRLH